MPNFAIIKPDGAINHITDALAQAESEAGQLNMVMVPLPEEISVLEALSQGFLNGHQLTLRDKGLRVDSTQTIHHVRLQRNYLLSICDWTQLPDVPDATQALWRSYRQALRDLPQQVDPFIADWPIAP
jgi:hypothetical protein